MNDLGRQRQQLRAGRIPNYSRRAFRQGDQLWGVGEMITDLYVYFVRHAPQKSTDGINAESE